MAVAAPPLALGDYGHRLRMIFSENRFTLF
jgi:hypothetical protein